ncbi:MAG: Large-conductance mechanosensitive channel, partial [uncultured Gemmatimonadaceae bacterium]
VAGVQGVRDARQRDGPRGRGHHRRRVRRGGEVAGRRRDHAADRLRDRRRRLQRPVPAPQARAHGGGAVRVARRREGGRRGHAQLRRVHQHDHHVPDRRARDLPARPRHQPPVPQAGRADAGHRALPVLHADDRAGGHAVPALHLAARRPARSRV